MTIAVSLSSNYVNITVYKSMDQYTNVTSYICILQFFSSIIATAHQFLLKPLKMRSMAVSLISIIFFLGLAISQEEVFPLSQGNCPHGWLDGSFVGLGYQIKRIEIRIIMIIIRCLLFNATEGMTWIESSIYCRSAYTNGSLVEILTVEVLQYLFSLLMFSIHPSSIFFYSKYFSKWTSSSWIQSSWRLRYISLYEFLCYYKQFMIKLCECFIDTNNI